MIDVNFIVNHMRNIYEVLNEIATRDVRQAVPRYIMFGTNAL